MTLVEFLKEVAGAELVFRREDEDDMLAVIILALPNGRRILALQRTYRDEINVLLDPTPEEIETAQGGSLWKLWNTERPEYLMSIV